ncbi:MAG: NfeD family protein [Victivallales bacterium]|nr:NfeD family protein [Victivallales bacterium]
MQQSNNMLQCFFCVNSASSWWCMVGALLICAEFVVPGFIIFFFGLGALLTGPLLTFCPLPSWAQFVIFSFSSLVFLLCFRRFMPNIFGGRTKNTSMAEEEFEYAGEPATVTEDIPAGGRGEVSFHGSAWTAVSETPRHAGETVTVVKRENLILHVK